MYYHTDHSWDLREILWVIIFNRIYINYIHVYMKYNQLLSYANLIFQYQDGQLKELLQFPQTLVVPLKSQHGYHMLEQSNGTL